LWTCISLKGDKRALTSADEHLSNGRPKIAKKHTVSNSQRLEFWGVDETPPSDPLKMKRRRTALAGYSPVRDCARGGIFFLPRFSGRSVSWKPSPTAGSAASNEGAATLESSKLTTIPGFHGAEKNRWQLIPRSKWMVVLCHLQWTCRAIKQYRRLSYIQLNVCSSYYPQPMATLTVPMDFRRFLRHQRHPRVHYQIPTEKCTSTRKLHALWDTSIELTLMGF